MLLASSGLPAAGCLLLAACYLLPASSLLWAGLGLGLGLVFSLVFSSAEERCWWLAALSD